MTMPRGRVRRLALTASVVVVALILMMWASSRERARVERVRHRIDVLFLEIASAEGRLPPLAPDPIVSAAVESRVRTILDAVPDARERMRIDVVSGDVQGFGQSRATHRAVISIDGRDFLGLRVRHDDASNRVEILGYWDP